MEHMFYSLLYSAQAEIARTIGAAMFEGNAVLFCNIKNGLTIFCVAFFSGARKPDGMHRQILRDVPSACNPLSRFLVVSSYQSVTIIVITAITTK